MRRDAVGRLRDRAEPPLAQVRLDAGEHAVDGNAGAPGRVDVRAEQPRPDRPLVVGGVALGRRAAVMRLVARVVGRRASAGRAASAATGGRRRLSPALRRRSAGDPGSDTASSWFGRTDASSPPGPSTTSSKPFPSARTNRAANDAAARSRSDAHRSPATPSAPDPQRVHLDRLAGALRDRHAVDAGVHPRQRPAVGALPQQPVGGVDGDAVARAVEVVLDDLLQHRRELVAEVVVAGDRRRGGRRRGRTRACRRPCCTRASRCRRCSRASPRRRSRPTCAAPRGPRRRGSSRGRAPRRRSSGRATTRRTTDSRRPRSGGRRS